MRKIFTTKEECDQWCVCPLHNDDCPMYDIDDISIKPFEHYSVMREARLDCNGENFYTAMMVDQGFLDANSHYEFEITKYLYWNKLLPELKP